MGSENTTPNPRSIDRVNNALPSKTWLSNGVELLFEREGLNKDGKLFDVIIVGSGYGGAMAAAELSKEGLSVCVLERGREFLPGSFPNSTDEAPLELRKSSSAGSKPIGNLEGLFDIRKGKDLNVLLANGLGGGSLINAGVMARAQKKTFDHPCWPPEINAVSLATYYDEAELLLGSKVLDENQTVQSNTIFSHPKFSGSDYGPSKFESLRKLSEASVDRAGTTNFKSKFQSANITVNMRQGQKTIAGLPLNACNLCGDCATGCNYNAKISLDKNLLAKASFNGVEIFTGATVLKVRQDNNKSESRWRMQLVYTDAQLRSRQSQTTLELKTNNVVLSAGALGSTEILKRSQSEDLHFSTKLGQQFSSNGDMITVGFDQNQIVNAIADPKTPHSKRGVGPTITGMIDLRDHPDVDKQIVIQEMAVPAATKHFFSELYSSVNTIQSLWSSDKTTHSEITSFSDPAALNDNTLNRTSLYAVMGDDGAKGELAFEHADGVQHEGTIQVQWPRLREHSLFRNQIEYLKHMSSQNKNSLGGEILPNPFWQLLKPEHMNMMNVELGAPLTVHPLGGCAMGRSIEVGVVNHRGQVFKPSRSKCSTDVYDGLFVLDGSLIPASVGINPALTISSISLKAIKELVSQGYFGSQPSMPTSLETVSSPISQGDVPWVRSPSQLEALCERSEKETKIQITERLVGQSRLENNDGAMIDVVIELTLWSSPISINALNNQGSSRDGNGVVLPIDSTLHDTLSGHPLSKIRIYEKSDWSDIRSGKIKADKHELTLDSAAKFIGKLDGNLTLFGRAKSNALSRITKSGWGWLLNRGMRDVYQVLRPTPWEKPISTAPRRENEKRSFANRISSLTRTLSRAGEIRTLNYNLEISKAIKIKDFDYFAPTNSNAKLPHTLKQIKGVKQLTYKRRSNPWSQLSRVSLTQLPKNVIEGRNAPKKNARLRLRLKEPASSSIHGTLTMDMNYLTSIGVPLARITQQENQVSALMDLSSFGAYIARIVLGIHFYSFRKPDTPKPREAIRLAGTVKELPIPSVHRIVVGTIPDNQVDGLLEGENVEIILTHYKHQSAIHPPVMMLHGYSGSSAFFAHSSTPNNLTKHIYEDKRDVWLVDLRTSSALSSARYPWKFETVSNSDIPTALSHIYNYYNGENKIDVIAHCMGSVMLSMAILRPCASLEKHDAKFFSRRINRIVFSQATPTVAFSQDNNFRSFATNYFKELIPDGYQFHDGDNKDNNQFIDRLLYTLPYPHHEYDAVNAPYRPSGRADFARTRHRVDALFARTFTLANLSSETLDHIDDFFGPIHVDTIIQASQFAHNNVATNISGGNNYVSRERLQTYWNGIPTMSFHSRNNGLIDFSTGERTRRIFAEAGLEYKSLIIENETYGHQDSIIGKNAHIDVFPHIIEFLSKPSINNVTLKKAQQKPVDRHWIVEAPTYGPIIIDNDELTVKVMLGSNAARACDPICVFIPITFKAQHIQIAGSNEHEQVSILNHCIEHSLSLNNTKDTNDSSRWNIVTIRKSMLTYQDIRANTSMDGVAALMLYNDLAELGEATIIEPNNHCSIPIRHSYSEASDESSLHSKLFDTIKHFFNSNQGVLSEFSNSVIEYAPNDYTILSNREKPFSFALGSCQYPAGILDKEVAYHSYKKLNQLLSDTHHKPQFIALIGDQIYADATAGFLDPKAKFDRFVQPYYRLYKNHHVRTALRKLPMFAMLDDHELSDNWEPVLNNPPKQNELSETRKAGVNSFLKFQRGITSNSDASETDSERAYTPLWYSFVNSEHDFFMFDTRTERSPRTATNILDPTTTLISTNQQTGFQNWLTRSNNDKPKFALSSSILLPRHRLNHASDHSAANCIRSDGWDGYPVSLYKILALIVDQQVENLVFLSGDEHLGCYAEIYIHNISNGKSAYTVSAHCPGLYTPFPFANSAVSDFEGHWNETTGQSNSQFNFIHDGSEYQCHVRAKFGLLAEKIQLGPIEIKACGGFLIVGTA